MISQKIVDFAVIDPESGDVRAIIELDDRTHDPAKDAKRDAMLIEGQYRVIRFTGRVASMEASVREKLDFLLKPVPDDLDPPEPATPTVAPAFSHSPIET